MYTSDSQIVNLLGIGNTSVNILSRIGNDKINTAIFRIWRSFVASRRFRRCTSFWFRFYSVFVFASLLVVMENSHYVSLRYNFVRVCNNFRSFRCAGRVQFGRVSVKMGNINCVSETFGYLGLW